MQEALGVCCHAGTRCAPAPSGGARTKRRVPALGEDLQGTLPVTSCPTVSMAGVLLSRSQIGKQLLELILFKSKTNLQFTICFD